MRSSRLVIVSSKGTPQPSMKESPSMMMRGTPGWRSTGYS